LTDIKEINRIVNKRNMDRQDRQESKLIAGNKGLANLGNTCYMNSILQCLSHLLTFHPNNKDFQKECADIGDCLMKEWHEFQIQMWSNEDASGRSHSHHMHGHKHMINPIRLLRCFQVNCRRHNYYFENFQQNDADEFLTIFLDLLHQGVSRPATFELPAYFDDHESFAKAVFVKSIETWRQFYSEDYSYIVKNFSSQHLQLTECPTCQYYTTNHDPVQVLSLEIPDDSKSLRDCLEAYVAKHEDDEDWICDDCKVTVTPVKQTVLWMTSDILILLLKRYTPRHKIERYLSYPKILDLNGINLNNGGAEDPNKYALQGFSVHSGSLGGGHYFAVCKNQLKKRWYEYNDTHVREISEDEMKEYSPYIFFYKRTRH